MKQARLDARAEGEGSLHWGGGRDGKKWRDPDIYGGKWAELLDACGV